MTPFIELEPSQEHIETCYENHYKSNVICSFMLYVLSIGLIMMGYMCQFYISLYVEELRKQTKIMTELSKSIENSFSEEDSETEEEDSETEEEDSETEEEEEDSETEEEEASETEKVINKTDQEDSDDIREIMNYMFGNINMGLDQP